MSRPLAALEARLILCLAWEKQPVGTVRYEQTSFAVLRRLCHHRIR
jgi:hypothetical protein